MKAGAAAVGIHILADLYGVDVAVLCDGVALERLLCQAARDAGARVLNSHFHSFGEGRGITGVVLLAESHISIHTWPEARLATLDIFMCGSTDGKRALTIVIDGLSPTDSRIETVARGVRRMRRTGVTVRAHPGPNVSAQSARSRR